MHTAVLGAGEVGSACALALLANQPTSHVSLLTRDEEFAQQVAHSTRIPFKAFPHHAISIPAALQVKALPKSEAASVGTESASDAVFVCTPVPALLPLDDPWKQATLRSRDESRVYTFLRRWASSAHASSAGAELPFVSVFTRGLAADGRLPAELVQRALTHGEAETNEQSHTQHQQQVQHVPLLVATGPLLAREWAAHSLLVPLASTEKTSEAATGSAAAAGGRGTSSIPPRPRSALTADSLAKEGESRDTVPTSAASEADKATGLPFPQRFSGTALSFALCSPRHDLGLSRAMEQLLTTRFFHRESVSVLHDPDGAHVLSVVNACLPLCAFGAGLVSNVYAATGGSVAALAAYSQHASLATQCLVNDVLQRAKGTPLPYSVYATLNLACTNHASREFVLGRQMDFRFRKKDAMEAVFKAEGRHTMDATADGLHSLLRRCGARVPFYEGLLDAYSALLRASVVGEGLVKEGYYDYLDGPASPLLGYAMRVDAAMFAGDDERFEKAKEELVQFMESQPPPAHSP